MVTIVGSGMAISVAIYMSLLIPVISLTTHIFRLSRLDYARECFFDDKFILLNEDERNAIVPAFTFITLSVICLVVDTFLIASTLLVHGVSKQ